jgi:3-hydroxyisobutyrate dehydrogenase-like beta-hydroxyacid dehydrogenase
MTSVAFLGLGRMGGLMAGRVLAAGHELTAWNRTAARTQPLVADGARATATPAEAAAAAEIVITMLAAKDVGLATDAADLQHLPFPVSHTTTTPGLTR